MPLRRLGCLVVALTLSAGCKDKDKDKDPGAKPAAPNLDARCEQLGKTCGDGDKQVKIVDGCKQAAKKQLEKVCGDKVTAMYDCFEKELCGKGDKVWTIEDLRVLADRHGKCAAERAATHDCVGE
jgi:hypothetical protein